MGPTPLRKPSNILSVLLGPKLYVDVKYQGWCVCLVYDYLNLCMIGVFSRTPWVYLSQNAICVCVVEKLESGHKPINVCVCQIWSRPLCHHILH